MFTSKPLIIDFQIAFAKAAKYCAYQERCHWDVENRLREWNIDEEIREEIVAELIQDNFLNEERFSKAFVSGKINIKRWGRNKIIYELKSRNISEYNIKSALATIDEELYLDNLLKTIALKKPLVLGKTDFEKRSKLMRYLVSKGYETTMINENLQ